VSGKKQNRRKQAPTVACAAITATTVVFAGPLCIKEYNELGAFWTAEELIANAKEAPQGQPFNRAEAERLLSCFQQIHPSAKTVPIIFVEENDPEHLTCMEILIGEDKSPRLTPLKRDTHKDHRVIYKVPPGTPDSILI
jgi:hypothetical protein